MTVALLVMPALRAAADGSFAHEEPRVAEALALGVGGFILFGGTATSVGALTEELVRRAGRPLLIGSDLERGAGQQFAGCTEFPPPAALAALDDLDAVATAASVTAQEARELGVNWIFAPNADLDVEPANPIVQTRSFGADPARVAECVRVWVEACESAGALACLKHYPGHGRTRTDSHAGLPMVHVAADMLAATDLVPFRAGIAAGVSAVMTAHVAFPALDPSGTPATRSRPIIDALRHELGFDGLVVTDALIMDGALVGRTEAEGVVDGVAAGVDLLLYPADVPGVVAALRGAVEDGRLCRDRVSDALARYGRAVAKITRPVVAERRRDRSAVWMAGRLLLHGLRRAKLGALTLPLDLVVVDDDLGGPYEPVSSAFTERALTASGVPIGDTGSKIVLLLAEPRAWKGRSGLGPETLRRLETVARDAALVVLFGHPRLMEQVPGPAPVLLAWHRQRLMQEAVARWLGEHMGLR